MSCVCVTTVTSDSVSGLLRDRAMLPIRYRLHLGPRAPVQLYH